MSDLRHDAERTAATLDLTSASAIAMKRCGDAELEADRRGAVRALVHGARSLGHALDRFASSATSHAAGVHCSPHMDTEVTAVSESLADWIYAVGQAARVEQRCSRSSPQPVIAADQHSPAPPRAYLYPPPSARLEAR